MLIEIGAACEQRLKAVGVFWVDLWFDIENPEDDNRARCDIEQ